MLLPVVLFSSSYSRVSEERAAACSHPHLVRRRQTRGIGAACFFFTKPKSSSLSCWVLLSKQNLTLIVSSSTKSTPLKMSVDSGIEDYSVGSASSINNKNVRILVTIPGAMMLDHMLMQLGLPPAEYQHKLYGDNKTCVSVTFNTSKVLFQGSLVPTTISGIRSIDVVVAHHTAAVAAIRCLESAANLVIKDLNYGRLMQLQKENKKLKTELKKAKFKSTRLGRGWFLSVRHMRSFAYQFHNMAILGYFGGQEVIHDDVKAAFSNINNTAQMLKERSASLQTKLDEVRKAP
ncbi:hypothetical protein QYE76_032951 [Lolium multiflorum]|uniref:Uncharacterized protein n=1 Tax=Lolium multiflorum TaxID=4521 RepID=A0AAD8QUL1_LOLMU|nr:hypothetical protein QYE76_032951 [Lolium multiflorum]